MKFLWTPLFLSLTTIVCFGQENPKKNALNVSIGAGQILRQDLIFSPLIHNDFSLMNLGLNYSRSSGFYQKISLGYTNFNPTVVGPYQFTIHGESGTAYPHSFNFINLDYQLGKHVKRNRNQTLIIGGLFSSDIQIMNYGYGRISSFGYFTASGLGVFGTYRRSVTEKSQFEATLKLPLFAWIARSPYLVNDDEFIENISSHSGFKTFTAFLGDGRMAAWDKIRTIDLEIKYRYDLNKRWGVEAAYLFEFVHMSLPRNLLSFRNSVNLSANFKF